MGMVVTAPVLRTQSSHKLPTLPMLSVPALLEDAKYHLLPMAASLPRTPERSDLGPATFPACK